MPKLSKVLLLLASVALVVSVFLGVNSSGVRAAETDQDGSYRQINVYSEVLRHVQTDYVEDPNIPAVTDGALRGLLESLDADSSYLTPADYKVYKAGAKGKAQIGLAVSKRVGYAVIVSVAPGSPADKAGLNDGDIIEAIGEQDTRDLSLAMIRLLLEGTPGSEVALSVVRPRKATPDKIILTRNVQAAPPVGETMYEDASILYLRPGVLDHEHVGQLESKLKSMGKSGNKKVLLDLREVAGGEMTEAVRAANLFLKAGTIGTLEGQKVPKQTFSADGKAISPTSPMVVLVNRGTAGPGELLAAALLDNKRAELVGEKTFGEGAQQKTIELPNGAAVILSVAKYESPSGKKLEDEGVTPGVLVASNEGDQGGGDDEDAAAATDTASKNAPAVKPQTAKPGPVIDDQLNKALDLLKNKAA